MNRTDKRTRENKYLWHPMLSYVHFILVPTVLVTWSIFRLIIYRRWGGGGGRLRRKLALILGVRPNKLLFDFFPDRVRLVAIVLTLPEIFACQDLMRKTVLSSVVVAYVPVS